MKFNLRGRMENRELNEFNLIYFFLEDWLRELNSFHFFFVFDSNKQVSVSDLCINKLN